MPSNEEPKPTKLPYPTCPSCGSSDFKIDGYVGYVQPYNARAGEYETSEMIWEKDIATGARCAGCGRDSTDLLKEYDVLAFYKLDLKVR